MSDSKFEELEAIRDYVNKQIARTDITEDTFNILKKISDELANVIYL